jgi:hypothetical protein
MSWFHRAHRVTKRSNSPRVRKPCTIFADAAGPRFHPARAGGLWLWKTLVPSGLRAVVVPSGWIVIDAETAELVVVAVQAALQAGAPSRPPERGRRVSAADCEPQF